MPIRWQVYPRSQKPSDLVLDIAECFRVQLGVIGTPPNKPSSDAVLTALRPGLVDLGFKVEGGKKKADKIRVPILFGLNGTEEKAFEVDAWSEKHRAIVEIEAGIAVDARKIYQDLFEAIVMPDIDFVCIALQNAYHPRRWAKGRDDFMKAKNTFDSLIESGRLKLPFETFMLLGY